MMGCLTMPRRRLMILWIGRVLDGCRRCEAWLDWLLGLFLEWLLELMLA